MGGAFADWVAVGWAFVTERCERIWRVLDRSGFFVPMLLRMTAEVCDGWAEVGTAGTDAGRCTAVVAARAKYWDSSAFGSE